MTARATGQRSRPPAGPARRLLRRRRIDARAEAPNSAVVGANLIPLLALGIPGNVTAALLVGAFIVHGFAPGPWMFTAMIMANILNRIIGGFGFGARR